MRGAGSRGRRAAARPGRFLLDVPECPRERDGALDLYFPDARLPADGSPRPAVVFVHGGPVPADAAVTPRDWPGFVGHARLAASLGAVGVTVEHRLHGLGDYERAAADVAAAVERVRAHPRVDGDRVALWFFSGGGLLATDWLAAPPGWLRCVAASYPVLAPLPNWGLSDARFRPADVLAGSVSVSAPTSSSNPAAVSGVLAGSPPPSGAPASRSRVPLVLTRVEREHPAIAATVAGFLARAAAVGADVEVVDVPRGRHGFETLDHTDEARAALLRSMRSVLGHLVR